MTIFTDLSNIPPIENLVLTIGTFDGIHLGHKELISSINEKAEEINGKSGLITFHPHPRTIIQSNNRPKIQLLTTIEERIAVLEQTGLNYLFIVPFSVDFANLTAQEYIEDFLMNTFNPKHLIIGYDHKFGKGRTGNFELLSKYQKQYHFVLEKVSEQKMKDLTYSSTNIRNFLLSGKIKKANKLLGYNYNLTGLVSHGEKLGRTIGYPTANLEVFNTDKLIPKKGVYAVKCHIFEQTFGGMINIGSRPTFNGSHKTIETHIFNFHETIYGHQLKIEFIQHIRDERKFDTKEALILQLKKDEELSKKIIQ